MFTAAYAGISGHGQERTSVRGQVRSYRGEIEKDSDIQNRIKFDVFYIENWSFLLDLKIIVQTVLNLFRGEEKAYRPAAGRSLVALKGL